MGASHHDGPAGPADGPGHDRTDGADAASASTLVLAGDIGATRSRLALAPLDGRVIAEAEGPGANLRSSGPDALDSLAETVSEVQFRGRQALGREEEIAAVALGVSGAGPARAAEIRRAVAERLARLGIEPARVLVTDDLRTAFLSGGVGDDGLLLLSGTGAVAVRFQDREPVARRDGMGWLLGDIGSAVWLGRRTLEAVAADLDDRGRRTLLTEQVGDLLELDLRDGLRPPSPTGDLRQDLIRALDEHLPAGAPAALGRFSRLPGRVSADPVAREILELVIEHVLDSARALDPEAGLPVVLAGSVLASPGPIHDGVARGLESDARSFRTVPDGLSGAMLLARELAGTVQS